MQVYIAAPLFNPQQIAVIEDIEQTLFNLQIDFYSPRLHSGSHLLTDVERKDPEKWRPVFESNIHGMSSSNVMVAVLNYILPIGQQVQLLKLEPSLDCDPEPVVTSLAKLKLPDTGTVWEMGYAFAAGIDVIGYLAEETKALNLMLPFGCKTLVSSPEELAAVLQTDCETWPSPQEVWKGKLL